MPVNLSKRSEEEELMDDLESSGEIIDQTLKELEVVNRLLGGNKLSLKGINKLIKSKKQETYTLVDIGCGGGDLLILMARWAKRKGYKMQFIGVDANPNIIAYAQEHCKYYPEISFKAINIFSAEFEALSCDIVHASLFTHHFTQQELIPLFKLFNRQAKVGMVINDLHRHVLAYYSIKYITRFFSKSAMVKNDGALSVARSFRRSDWLEIFEAADIKKFDLSWKWAFRWKIVVYN